MGDKNRKRTSEEYMLLAIDLSRKSRFPYGAVLVKDDYIIGRSDWGCGVAKSSFTHAEMIAIDRALAAGIDVSGATLYSSCEPCIMCAGAILQHGVGELYFGCTLQDSHSHVTPELILPVTKLAKIIQSDIIIHPQSHRAEALQAMEEWAKVGDTVTLKKYFS